LWLAAFSSRVRRRRHAVLRSRLSLHSLNLKTCVHTNLQSAKHFLCALLAPRKERMLKFALLS
jgi:hypothetical protein